MKHDSYSNMMREFFGSFFHGKAPGEKKELVETQVVPSFERPGERNEREEAIAKVRASRLAMNDEAWVARIVHESDLSVEAPEGYRGNDAILSELASVPPEGVRQARTQDAPPPPLGGYENPIIPKRVYSNGLVWEVGSQIGQGASGRVFEITHAGGSQQRKRVVKFMHATNDQFRRAALWNEVGVTMLTGDYVGSEVMQEDGDTWVALVLERHKGETAWNFIQDKRDSEADYGFNADPKVAFRVAAMIRSVVHSLRRVHSAGWIHRDVKPGNIIFNTQEGEEFLSRLIDFGSAERKGNVRKKVDNFLIGTPRFMFQDMTTDTDIDSRARDYWGVMITAVLALRLVEEMRGGNIRDVIEQLQRGTRYEAPRLDDEEKAKEFFRKHKLPKAQQDFCKWLYAFIRPYDSIERRQSAWLASGVTRMVEVGELPADEWVLTTNRNRELRATFIDDDRFVRELEGHVRALGAQIGRKDVDQTLALLQEFPTS